MSEQAVLHGSPAPQVRRLEVPRRRRRILPFSRAHLFLFPLTVLMLFPLYWIFVTSLMSLSEAQQYPPVFWPHHLLWRNYPTTWHDAPFGLYLLNTTFVSVAVVVLNLVFCSLAGYAFARIRFRGRNTVFFALLLTVMVPSQVTIIPTFIIVRWMGQHISPFVGINSLGALIVPYAIDVFGIFMLRQFFLSLPVELEEAAMIDGTSRLGILFKIVLPLSLPALATLGALEFLNVWNDFLWPLVVIQSSSHYTVQLGLANFQGIHTTDWNLLMAGNVISLLPMIGVFFLAQRYFIRSVATAGLKG
jgi:multiple sugar transport system permease protein